MFSMFSMTVVVALPDGPCGLTVRDPLALWNSPRPRGAATDSRSATLGRFRAVQKGRLHES